MSCTRLVVLLQGLTDRPCATLCAMADALLPPVQRPRADQGTINSAQAVVPQAEPPLAAEHAPQPDQLPNPPAEQIEVFHYFLFLLYLFVFMFSSTLFSSYTFLLGFAFFFVSFLYYVIHILSYLLVYSLYSCQYAMFFTHCSFYFISPFALFFSFSFWYIFGLYIPFLCRPIYFYCCCSLVSFKSGQHKVPLIHLTFFIFAG